MISTACGSDGCKAIAGRSMDQERAERARLVMPAAASKCCLGTRTQPEQRDRLIQRAAANGSAASRSRTGNDSPLWAGEGYHAGHYIWGIGDQQATTASVLIGDFPDGRSATARLREAGRPGPGPVRANRSQGRDRACGRAQCARGRPPRRSDSAAPSPATGAPAPDIAQPRRAHPRALRVSIPTEKSLHSSRPAQQDAPACQARASHDTNCSTRPSRRMKKCADTRKPRRPSK